MTSTSTSLPKHFTMSYYDTKEPCGLYAFYEGTCVSNPVSPNDAIDYHSTCMKLAKDNIVELMREGHTLNYLKSYVRASLNKMTHALHNAYESKHINYDLWEDIDGKEYLEITNSMARSMNYPCGDKEAYGIMLFTHYVFMAIHLKIQFDDANKNGIVLVLPKNI